MTRNGKIARLPAAIREELNQRLRCDLYDQRLRIEQNKQSKSEKQKTRRMTPEEREQKLKALLGINEGYDGSIHPELTRPPAEFQPAQYKPVQVSTSEFK